MPLVERIQSYSDRGYRIRDLSFSGKNCEVKFSDGKTVHFDKTLSPVFSYDACGDWVCNSQVIKTEEGLGYRFDGSLPAISTKASFWTIGDVETDVPVLGDITDTLVTLSYVFVNRQEVYFTFSDGRVTVIKKGPKKEIEDYFAEVISVVADKISTLNSKSDCFILCELADLHEKTGHDKYVNRADQSIENVAELCRRVSTNGVIFMGDALWPDDASMYLDQSAVRGSLTSIAERLTKIHDKVYLMLGNHDGIGGSVPSGSDDYEYWFNFSDPVIERDSGNPWYYFDDMQTKVRCIVLSAPDLRSEEWVWSYSEPQLKWLAEVALNTDDGWHVLIFSHTHPYCVSGNTPLQRNEILSGILNAYHRHTQFQEGGYSYDYSRYSSAEIAAMFVAHAHEDNVITRGNSFFTGYDLDFPTIVTDKCMTWGQSESKGESGGISWSRKIGTVSQDLWDTIVYNPNEGVIHMVRFGAGEDRVIELTR